MFWPEEVSVGEVVYPPGGHLGPRFQRNLQLVILHTGHVTIWIDNEQWYAPAYSVIILFPGHEERFVFAENTKTWHSWIHIYSPHFPTEILERLTRLPRVLPLSSVMNDLTGMAFDLHRLTLAHTPEILKSLAVHMLWRFVAEGELQIGGEQIRRVHPAIERARHFIHTNLVTPLTLVQIAEAVAVTPAHLIRLFRSEMQTTPMAYVWEKRVAMGVELLERTGLPVGVIAERSGFQTSYHFSRRVRHITGLSPSDIRKRSWSLG
jgi:AraC-like DNA-binding protein